MAKGVEQAYLELESKLHKLVANKKNLEDQVSAVTQEESKVKKALEGLLPFIESNSHHARLLISNTEIKWRAEALRILTENPNKKYTSPELFDLIHPDAKRINVTDRRRALVNLSQALSVLSIKHGIKCVDNEHGRGYLYYYEK